MVPFSLIGSERLPCKEEDRGSNPRAAVSWYDAFGQAAAEIDDPAVAIGYHPFQADEVANNLTDVIAKLNVRPEHRLLEIGFGTGLLLLPLAEIVREAVGIDHPACVERLRDRTPQNVLLLEGRWPNMFKPTGTFDRVLAYNVLQYLESRSEAWVFIRAAADMLAPGGMLLLGALPNVNAAARFRGSRAGREFDSRWRERLATDGVEVERAREIFQQAPPQWTIDDEFVAQLLSSYRCLGYQTYVLPHSEGLPHHHTREDVLIKRL